MVFQEIPMNKMYYWKERNTVKLMRKLQIMINQWLMIRLLFMTQN